MPPHRLVAAWGSPLALGVVEALGAGGLAALAVVTALGAGATALFAVAGCVGGVAGVQAASAQHASEAKVVDGCTGGRDYIWTAS